MAQVDFDMYWSEVDVAEHEELSRSRCWVCDEDECDCTPADHDNAERALHARLLATKAA